MKLIRENEMYQDNRKLHELVDPNGRWGLTTKEGGHSLRMAPYMV